MLDKDIYGKPLSNSFNSAIEASAQKVKPKITIQLLDSRHMSNVSATSIGINQSTLQSRSNSTPGAFNHYFSWEELVNGKERQSFPWAVAGALDYDGHVIRANGQWFTMPSSASSPDDDYEFGWWSSSKSYIGSGFAPVGIDFDSGMVAEGTYPPSAGDFSIYPILLLAFDKRKINKIVITTSEFNGPVNEFQIRVINNDYGDLLNEDTSFDNGYKKEFLIKSQVAEDCNYLADQIEIKIKSTVYPNDFARIHEINAIYEEDVTDQVLSYSISRTRDIHDSSLPIGGTQTNTLSLTLDNTEKDWSIFNSSSTYGQYMVKDLKVNVATGWRIKKTDEIILETSVSDYINSSNTVLYVDNVDIAPDDEFIVIVDPETENREIILCNSTIVTSGGKNGFTVVSRGYAGTTAKEHEVGATVQFDPYEYVPAGTFYIDEWKSSTTNMSVEIQATDWSKFLNEATLTRGYMLKDTTVGNAVRHLLMKRNFPRADISVINQYHDDAIEKNCFSIYSFNDVTINRSENFVTSANSLRARFWAMTEGNESTVKDIVGQIRKPISKTDIIFGTQQAITPDVTVLTSEIASNSSFAVKLESFSFETKNGDPCSTYFNGVIDGYYIPNESGNQNINLYVTNGGARIYLNNIPVASKWFDNQSETAVTTNGYTPSGYSSTPSYLDLTAGKPYPIRIEFFHTNKPNSFGLSLFKQMEGLDEEPIPSSSFQTVVARNTATLKSFGISAQLDGEIGSANIANGDPDYEEFSYYVDDATYVGNVLLNQPSGIISDSENKAAYLQDGGYIRIPLSNNISFTANSDFTYEIVAKFNNDEFDNDGEYISSFANSSPDDGIEFYYNNNGSNLEHGAKIVTDDGIEEISFVSELSNSDYSFITLTCKDNVLNYYLNGELANTVTLTGNKISQTTDLIVGGRGAYYDDVTGSEVGPETARSFYIDELIKYKLALTEEQVKERYISAKIQELNVFPFLFGNDTTYRAAIDEVTLAELGRFYIDELDKARYEHYFRFFEPEIDQHANVQYTISDSSHIISSDLTVQLQANKVTLNLSKLNTGGSELLPLWKPDSNTFLRAIELKENMSADQTSVFVESTSDLAFPNSGYFIIDNEIIKYGSKTENTFENLSRGFFSTTANSHLAGSLVREVRYYQAKYDKSPAFNVKVPLITAIFRVEPDLVNILKFEPSAYTAEVIIAASNNVPANSFAIVEGTDIDGLPWGMSIAGTAVVISEVDSVVGSDSLGSVSSELIDNIRKYGLKEIKIENIFMSDRQYAEKIVNFIISKMKDPVPIITMETMVMPKLQLGDRIRISSFDSFDIINGDFWVISHTTSYGSSLAQSVTLRKVV